MKIKLGSYDNDLPLNKVLCFSVLNIIVESVFQIVLKFTYMNVNMSVNMSVSINFLETFMRQNLNI